MIVAYRKQNGLPEIELLPDVVENYLCTLPCHRGKCGRNTKLHRSVWTYLKGGVALLRNMLIENPVSRDEAERRASICSGCVFNVFPDKDRYVAWSDRVAEAAVPGKRLRYHNELGNCEVCTCTLKAKVWAPGPFSLSSEEKEKMESVGCWQLVQIKNHRR